MSDLGNALHEVIEVERVLAGRTEVSEEEHLNRNASYRAVYEELRLYVEQVVYESTRRKEREENGIH